MPEDLPALALFDFDGTITTREMLPDFFRLAIPKRRVQFGGVLLAPLIIGYKLGVVSGSLLRAAIVRLGFTGVPLQRYRDHGLDFARSVLPGVIRPEATERIAWHRARGDRVIVVSGALDVYLAPWCEAQGLELICSALEHRDGRLTGHYEGPQCVSSCKRERVLQRVDRSAYSEIYAYGDTVEDRELLELASRRFYRGQEVAEIPV
ncbi:MAG: HAD family hydrolase [Lysobacterales bacterium]